MSTLMNRSQLLKGAHHQDETSSVDCESSANFIFYMTFRFPIIQLRENNRSSYNSSVDTLVHTRKPFILRI